MTQPDHVYVEQATIPERDAADDFSGDFPVLAAVRLDPRPDDWPGFIWGVLIIAAILVVAYSAGSLPGVRS